MNMDKFLILKVNKIQTSYFSKYKGDNGINIAIGKPKFYKGPSYPDLFPTWELLKHYKKYNDKEYYVLEYQKQILLKLNPDKVYDDLKDKVLLCWERSGEFCHRRIIAAWVYRYTGHIVNEI